jgi:hypothetical protein
MADAVTKALAARFLAVGFPASAVGAERMAGAAASWVEVVDLHAHFFNMFYLPVVGALTALGVPDWVAKAIHAILKDIAGDPETAIGATPAAASEKADLVAKADDRVDLDAEVEARDAVAGIVRPEVFRDPDVLLALDRMDASATSLLPEGAVKRMFARQRRVETGRFGLAGRGEQLVAELARDRDARRVLARGIMDNLTWDTFKWMYLLTKPERRIMEKLEKTYPEVTLFVHSMMDMDLHYDHEPPYYSITAPPWGPDGNDQVSRTARLVASAKGRFVALVAWDPFRKDGLEIVKAAIEDKGFKGVKFYPSSGYRPIDNVAEIVEPMDPKLVDQNNLNLYGYCVANEVPIFAHCALGDMQARPGFDTCADPKWWRKVLEFEADGRRPYRELRLCFAHAGGAAEWALPPAMDHVFARSWAGEVHALCNDPRFPNVYADFGMFRGILDDQQRDWFGKRLERLFSATDASGEPTPFASRACYGSDWSMLYRVKDQARYLDRFRELFARPGLAGHARRFFGQNARTFVRL